VQKSVIDFFGSESGANHQQNDFFNNEAPINNDDFFAMPPSSGQIPNLPSAPMA
jgi:hypothetical protein